MRERLPSRRPSWTQRAEIDGHVFYASFGEYYDGRLGELWVNTENREGTFADGVLGAMARSVSIAMQSGTPVSEVVQMLKGLSFPPSGTVVGSPVVREAASVADWVAQEVEHYYGETGSSAVLQSAEQKDEQV